MIVITKKGDCMWIKRFKRKGLMLILYVIRNIVICDEVSVLYAKWL
jgi:hypothetical protein